MDEVSLHLPGVFGSDDRKGAYPLQPEPHVFGNVPSQDGEAGPTIPANRRPSVPENFLTLADARDFARWSFNCGLFLGAIGAAVLGAIAAVLT